MLIQFEWSEAMLWFAVYNSWKGIYAYIQDTKVFDNGPFFGQEYKCYGTVWPGMNKLFGTVWPGMKIVWYGDDSALLFQFQFEVMRLVSWSGWHTLGTWGGLVQEMICRRVGKMKWNLGQICQKVLFLNDKLLMTVQWWFCDSQGDSFINIHEELKCIVICSL